MVLIFQGYGVLQSPILLNQLGGIELNKMVDSDYLNDSEQLAGRSDIKQYRYYRLSLIRCSCSLKICICSE